MSGELLLYGGLVLAMLVGVVGAIVPAVPGAGLVLAAIALWGLIKGFGAIALPLAVAAAVFVLCLAIDWLAGIWGAQKAGAGPWAQWGALIGAIAGIFGLLPALPIGGPIAGLLLGPLVGAFLGEFLYRRKTPLTPRLKGSLKAAVGIFVGTIVGRLVQASLALVATIVFLISTWSQVVG